MCGIDEGVWKRKHNRKKKKSVGRKFSTNFLRNFRTYTFGCSLNSKYPDYGITVCTILFAFPSFRLHLFAISSLMLCVCCAVQCTCAFNRNAFPVTTIQKCEICSLLWRKCTNGERKKWKKAIRKIIYSTEATVDYYG